MNLLSVIFLLLVSQSETKSAKSRVTSDDLSGEKHYDHEGKHNSEYDHEAFLGKEAKTFDQLTPTESKERLGELFDKVDKNGDEVISENELLQWIKFVRIKHVWENVDSEMKQSDLNKDGQVTWAEYINATYGIVDGEGEDMYKDNIARDSRRFQAADKNDDMILNKSEMGPFLHPDVYVRTKHVAIDEMLEDMDKNMDKHVDVDEYVDFVIPHDEKNTDYDEQLARELQDFKEKLDKDKDGKLDHEEVGNWLLPTEPVDHALIETKHLLAEADINENFELTKEEVLDRYDVFVGSVATDYGKSLNEIKTEL